MVPDDEPKPAPEPAQTPGAKDQRRSGHGRRRHSRRRGGPRAPMPQPAMEAEQAEPAGVPALAGEIEHEPPGREPESPPKTPAVSQAIEQVSQVIEELKRAVEEMELVLETLEFAERQKIDDEREIEALQRALRQLHRPGLSRR